MTYTEFDDAEVAAEEATAASKRAGEEIRFMVCGTLLVDGAPVYFLMEADDADDAVRDRAFLVRNDREMSQVERMLLDWAQRGQANADRDR